MYEFKLPDLGEGIHEGEILKWHVTAGQQIREDEPLVDVETDKAAVTIPSPRSGRVAELFGEVGDTIRVGSVVAVFANGDEAPRAAAAPAKQPAQPTKQAAKPAPPAGAGARPAPGPVRGAQPRPAGGGEGITEPPARMRPPEREGQEERAAREAGEQVERRTPGAPGEIARPAPPSAAAASDGARRRVPAAPATRRLARELGVDIDQVPPTGPGGRVTPEDVHRFAAGAPAGADAGEPAGEPAAEPAEATAAVAEFAAHAAGTIPFLDLEPLPEFEQWGPVEREPLRSIRRRVAHKMVTSMVLVPHVAHMDEADVTDLEAFRRRERERRQGQPGGKLTLLSFVIKAVTAGLKATPAFNASLDPFREEVVFKRYYHIGIAADTGRGLVVPVVRDTDRKSIVQISAEIERLAGRAREGKLEAAEMRGGTFTVTNIGPLGGTALLPTINYPEVAILAMGQVQEKPVVREGQIVIRKILPLTLAFDHRIADGADAARFVREMVRQLSDPNLLLLET